MKSAAPVGDFESRRRRESPAGGGFSRDPHATELIVVLLLASHSPAPVLGPANVSGAEGLVALLQIHRVQVSAQLIGYSAGPALSGDSLTGFHL